MVFHIKLLYYNDSSYYYKLIYILKLIFKIYLSIIQYKGDIPKDDMYIIVGLMMGFRIKSNNNLEVFQQDPLLAPYRLTYFIITITYILIHIIFI